MVTFQARTRFGCAYVADHLRARDAAEIAASRGPFDRADFAADLYAAEAGFEALHDGIPCAVVAIAHTRMPRVGTVGMVATDDWPHIGLQVSRACGILLPRYVFRSGLARLECRSVAGYGQAHRWLRWLGFRHEATLPRMGWAGEDFELYAWVAADVRREPVQAEGAEDVGQLGAEGAAA